MAARQLKSSLVFFAIFVLMASVAHGLEYELRWEGKLGGNNQFYIPQRIASGNLTHDAGDELLVIDNEGFAYFMGWRGGRLENLWITSKQVANGHVSALAIADVDNCGIDEGALIGPEGELILLGGGNKDFEIICTACLPEAYADFRADFLVPIQADKDSQVELVLIGTMNGVQSALVVEVKEKKVSVIKAVALPPIQGEIMSIWPASNPPDDRFYVSLYLGADGDAVLPLRLNEEGFALEPAIELDGAELAVRSIFSADTDNDMRTELYVSGTAGHGLDAHPVMIWFVPVPATGTEVFKPMPVSMPEAGFMAAPDLNGDGLREILLVSYSGEAHIMSLATLTLNVKGAKKKLHGNIILYEQRPFIPLSILPSVKVKEKGTLVMVNAGKYTMVVNRIDGTGTVTVPNQEEPRAVSLELIREEEVVYYDAESLGESLGMPIYWTPLTQTLSIKK